MGRPSISAGNGGSDGATQNANDVITSSGAAARNSRARSATSCARSAGYATNPCVIVGPSSCSRNSNDVTMPKLGPAPRIPQNRSAFSSSLTRSRSPSAVTRSTASMLSTENPHRRWSRPIPPPRVSPATPVWPTTPTGHASPWACDCWSSSESSDPPFTRAMRRSGSTCTPRICERSITIPPSHVEKPPTLWPPERTAITKILVTREADRPDHVLDPAAPGDDRGATVDHGVPHDAGRVIVGAAGENDLARELPAEGLQRNHVHAVLKPRTTVGLLRRRGAPSARAYTAGRSIRLPFEAFCGTR